MLVLSRNQIEQLLDLDLLLEGLAEGFIALSAGRTSVPPRVAAFAPTGLLGAMPGYVDDVLEAKLVAVFPDNHACGLASHHALICLFDGTTGEPKAVLDGEYITAMRTAGSSALATRVLARNEASRLAIIGAGVQGRAHLNMLRRVRNFKEVAIASRNPTHATELAETSGGRHAKSFEDAVRRADVVCLCTDASTPVIERDWISAGSHITSVGANPRGGELDKATIDSGLLVVESRVAFEPPPAGSFELQGLDPASAVELGEILAGSHPGRTGDNEITVYKSMGHAVEDAVAARLVYVAALESGAGATVRI